MAASSITTNAPTLSLSASIIVIAATLASLLGKIDAHQSDPPNESPFPPPMPMLAAWVEFGLDGLSLLNQPTLHTFIQDRFHLHLHMRIAHTPWPGPSPTARHPTSMYVHQLRRRSARH